MPKLDNLVFEDARIMFRNFAGLEKQFNSEGDRNFCLMLDPDKAEAMRAEGWNVKQLRPREEGDVPQDYVQVAVSYKNRPPKVVLLTNLGTKRVDLDEETVKVLDYADVKNWDVILNPYEWTMHKDTPSEKKGIKAYLKSAFITLNEDELELKYAGIDDDQVPTMSSIASDD